MFYFTCRCSSLTSISGEATEINNTLFYNPATIPEILPILNKENNIAYVYSGYENCVFILNCFNERMYNFFRLNVDFRLIFYIQLLIFVAL